MKYRKAKHYNTKSKTFVYGIMFHYGDGLWQPFFNDYVPIKFDNEEDCDFMLAKLQSESGHVLLCVADGEELPYGVTNSCDYCEFNMTEDEGGAIGAKIGSRGKFAYCEKGYWREDT